MRSLNNTLAALTLLLALLTLAPAPSAHADTILYSQATSNNSSRASQNAPNRGATANFATTYDDFVLNSPSSINSVSWYGDFYDPSTASPISAFAITFYADEGGEPGAVLATENISGDADATSLGFDNANNPYFSYSAALPQPFITAPGTKYWMSIVPTVNFQPQWGWEGSNGGDGTACQTFNGDLAQFSGDQAFTLTGGAIPSPYTEESPISWQGPITYLSNGVLSSQAALDPILNFFGSGNTTIVSATTFNGTQSGTSAPTLDGIGEPLSVTTDAGTINFGTPIQTITFGNPSFSYGGGDDCTYTQVANGITTTLYDGGDSAIGTARLGATFAGNATCVDPNFLNLVANGAVENYFYGATPALLTFSGLNVSQTYAVELLTNEGRSGLGYRQVDYADTGINPNTSPVVTEGNFQAVIGVFTATSSTESIAEYSAGSTLNLSGNINAIVLATLPPHPNIFTVSPSGALHNAGDTTLTLTGGGFNGTSVVYATPQSAPNQPLTSPIALATTFVSSSELQAVLPVSVINKAYSDAITVEDFQTPTAPPSISPPGYFLVGFSTDSISPRLVPVNTNAFQLTVHGEGFDSTMESQSALVGFGVGFLENESVINPPVYVSPTLFTQLVPLSRVINDNFGSYLYHFPQECEFYWDQPDSYAVTSDDGNHNNDVIPGYLEYDLSYLPQSILNSLTLTLGPPMGVTAQSVTNVTPTSATVNWKTSYAGTCALRYGTTNVYGSTTTVTDSGTSHSATLTGLAPGMLYQYQITATDVIDTASPNDVAVGTATGSFVSAPAVGTPNVVASVSSVSRDSSNNVVVAMKLLNIGAGPAAAVSLNAAFLGSAPAKTALPVSIGTIAAGGASSVTLTFPPTASGRALFTPSGAYTGGAFGAPIRVFVP